MVYVWFALMGIAFCGAVFGGPEDDAQDGTEI